MNLAEAWRTLPLGAADRHAEALTLGATRALRAGRPADAFELIDRRCRIPPRPRAVDLAIRALAAHLCGFPADAERDLRLAETADPLDPMVAMTRLRLASGPDAVRRVAEALAAAGQSSVSSLLGALLARLAATEAAPCLVVADILDGRLSGFAAWPAGRGACLELAGPDGHLALPLAGDPALAGMAGGLEACLLDARPPFAPARWRLRAGEGGVLAEGPLWPRGTAPLGSGPARRAPADVPRRAPLSVVVPVHSGLTETQDCLDALLAEAGLYADVRVVVVDDASPDPRIAALLDGLPAGGAVELRRNAANRGFAAAVAVGLEGQAERDVLVLNADAVLPPGALDRLADAVHSAPDIGTATPFSNNGEYTSLPRHAAANAAPSPEDARRIDAAAARVGGAPVDLPTGTGFCLYVRHDCMAAVGGMPLVYGRGYLEDLEFCLRARRAGFRNVCVPSLYVVHHGARSFGGTKAALAVRNLGLVRQRFPGIEAECAAYAGADPLAEARGRVVAAAGLAADPDDDVSDGPLIEATHAAPDRPLSLGVLSPSPAPANDAFVRQLSAALRARLPAARIVVLGRCCDDLALMGRGNVLVTGPVAPGERRRLAARLGIVALAPPLDGSPAAFLEAAIRLDLPVLSPDPAAPAEPGARPPDHPDHVHDPARAIVAQFARRLEA